MLKITNGKEILLVTNGAFKSQYKPFGWNVVEEEEKTVKDQVVLVEGDDLPIVEKPLSEMTSKELKVKAKELGVDISGANSKAEARKMLADVIK